MNKLIVLVVVTLLSGCASTSDSSTKELENLRNTLEPIKNVLPKNVDLRIDVDGFMLFVVGCAICARRIRTKRSLRPDPSA